MRGRKKDAAGHQKIAAAGKLLFNDEVDAVAQQLRHHRGYIGRQWRGKLGSAVKESATKKISRSVCSNSCDFRNL